MMETIIITTILLAVFLCLRSILDGKISARLQYGVWLLVALRLLLVGIPLPESSVSVMNLLPVVQDSFQYLNQNVFGEKTEKLGVNAKQEMADLQVESELLQEDAPTKDAAISQDMGEQQIKSSVQSAKGQQLESEYSKGENGLTATLPSLVYRIYGIGAFIVLVWMIAKNLWFWNRLRRRRIQYEGQLPVAALPGRLYLVEHLKSPFLFGRHIYVAPEMMSDQKKLHHILVHESCHWKQGDSLWSVLRCLCLVVYWYHPLVWYGIHLSIVDAELACDERAIRVLGKESRHGYGETLLGLIRKQAAFWECTRMSTQMSGNKQETKKRLERIMEQRKPIRGIILFLIVSMLALCLITLPGKKLLTDMGAADQGTQPKLVGDARWERVKQEGFPCIVVNEDGNITGSRRGELLTKVVLDYTARNGNGSVEPKNYQIQAGAFSECPNLKTLILPYQNASEGVIDYIDSAAFSKCSEDLVVYCAKESYVWSRLKELGITVKEIPDEQFEWRLLGEDTNTLKQIQEKLDSAKNDSVLTEQEMRQFFGEPFFIMTESGQLIYSICESLSQYTGADKVYLPTDAHTLAATFPQYIMNQPITIPKNITAIGDSSFMCSLLPAVTFEEGSKLQTIAGNAFMESEFTKIQLPEGLLEIGKRAFSGCHNLIEITIPESVHTLGSNCFLMCDSLERVVILNPDITLGEDVFEDEILNPDLGEDEIDMENLDSNFIPNNRLTIVCHRKSNAEKYAKEHGLQIEYLE